MPSWQTCRRRRLDGHRLGVSCDDARAQARRETSAPPTRFVVNKFTACFQETVDTYGVARYREANPALFTAITFPFLFGVMYGDIGHGTCLLLMGLFLVVTESRAAKQKGELMIGLYFGRYMILLMGIFAVYCGLLYNDFFSLGLDVFGSKWEMPVDDSARCVAQKKLTGRSQCSMFPVGTTAADGNALVTEDKVYAFGVDPAWHGTSNELLFYNSLKMKLSVTLGVAQMLVGILLKGWNALHFEQRLDFFWEFVPQLIFACSVFGYLIVMIFVKWSIDWNVRMGMNTEGNGCTLKYGGTGQGCQPPSIIATLIDMVLKPGVVADPMYAGQAAMQSTLLTAAMISVPAMLLVKVPLPLCSQHYSLSFSFLLIWSHTHARVQIARSHCFSSARTTATRTSRSALMTARTMNRARGTARRTAAAVVTAMAPSISVR